MSSSGSSGISRLKSLLGVILIGVLAFTLAWLVEPKLLQLYVYTPPDITLEDWTTNFQYWTAMVSLSATFAALIWCVLGEWVFEIRGGEGSDKSLYWYLLIMIPLAFTIWVALFKTCPVQTGFGQILSYVCYCVNILIAYFIATACFSPAKVKLIPWGAARLRIEKWF